MARAMGLFAVRAFRAAPLHIASERTALEDALHLLVAVLARFVYDLIVWAWKKLRGRWSRQK